MLLLIVGTLEGQIGAASQIAIQRGAKVQQADTPEGALDILRRSGADLVMIDVDTAIINPTQLPFWFLEKLKELNIRTIEVNPEDPSGAVNCIAVKPGRLIMEAGLSPRTAETLDKLGIEIIDVKYDKIWLGGGGIHCSTSPLIRDSI